MKKTMASGVSGKKLSLSKYKVPVIPWSQYKVNNLKIDEKKYILNKTGKNI